MRSGLEKPAGSMMESRTRSENGCPKAKVERRWVMAMLDVAAWVFIATFFVAIVWTMVGASNVNPLPRRVPPQLWVVVGSVVPFICGVIWLAIRNGRRIADGIARLQRLDPAITLERLPALGMIFIVIAILLAALLSQFLDLGRG
jgi:hypothetical protein